MTDNRAAAPPGALHAFVSAPSRLVATLRRDPPAPRVALLLLCLLSGAFLALSYPIGSQWVSPSLQTVTLLLGGLLLTAGPYLRLALLCGALVAVQFATTSDAPPGSVIVLVFAGLLAYEFARSRGETGLGGLTGDTMLMELRNRLTLQGEMPVLPSGWRADPKVLPAGDAPFAGDFVVSALTAETRLEVALVDVSGKGVEAGTRSLLLSGALGGLLGAQDTQEFLAASNAYLMRQDWDEGFATAVHLTLDLVTGEFEVASAGHPPVARFDAGSGRWSLLEINGPALGLLPDVVFPSETGVLRPGDALLMYTDGLVEVPGRDLSVGIDKLLGEAERLVTRGFDGGAADLMTAVAANGSDDRGLVLIWRLRG